MSNARGVPLSGSYRLPVTGAHALGRAPAGSMVQLTVQLAPRNPQELAAKIGTPGYTPYTRDEFVRKHAPRDPDIAAVRTYLENNGLTVSAISPDRRVLTVTGTVAAAERAFGTQLTRYESNGHQFYARTGPLTVPAEVEPLIEGIFGLDTRPAARPHVRGKRQNPDHEPSDRRSLRET